MNSVIRFGLRQLVFGIAVCSMVR